MTRFIVLCAVLLLACGQQTGSDMEPAPVPADSVPEPGEPGETPEPGMQLTSSAFTDGQTMPKQYTGDGKNISPPLAWTDPPEGTRSFALICNDPDAPRGDFIHWVIYNLGPETTTLNSSMPRNQVFEDGSGQGTNSFGRIGYDGPLPPPGKPHRYFFNLYALDIVLSADDPPGDAAAAMKAMEGHVLATATLMGLYGR